VEPSPKSKVKETMAPVEPAALKVTERGAGPEVGVAESFASKGLRSQAQPPRTSPTNIRIAGRYRFILRITDLLVRIVPRPG
jgi:hypothetical protein